MSVPLLSELREPPVVGRYYMVPVVRFPHADRVRDWPVIGPLHTDKDFFKFEPVHYHIDIRFVGKRDLAHLASLSRWRHSGSPQSQAALTASGYPLNHRDKQMPTGRPPLARRLCQRRGERTPLLEHLRADVRMEFEGAYGVPAEAIHRADGRKLCPHRKVDLSTFEPDADGIVVCPLHGLPVRCGQPSIAA